MRIINFSSANCKNCYKCLRACPVKAIRFSQHQAQIDENRCVACGQCFVVCPQNARHIKSDLHIVQEAIREKKEVVVSLAPSFAGFFEPQESFVTALKRLGFSRIEETAIGAQAVTKAYSKEIKEGSKDYLLTTCCPTVNLLIERYYEGLIPYMLPYVSPMIAHGKSIKKRIPEAFTVFIGPCISKKCEALNQYQLNTIDAVLTFEEVSQWLELENLSISQLPPMPLDAVAESTGRSYPITGGIGKNLATELETEGYDLISINGLNNIKGLLEDLDKKQLSKAFIELSACNESCMGGPAIPKLTHRLYQRKQMTQRYIQRASDHRMSHQPFETPAEELTKRFYSQKVEQSKVAEDDLMHILKKMGKYETQDELNCGACGYNTCRDKALAIYEGMSEVDMCMPFMRSKAETMNDMIFHNSPNAIFVIDERLSLVDYNDSARLLFHINGTKLKGKPISVLMDDEIFREVVRTKKEILNKKVPYSKYGLVAILNVLYLEKENFILAILTNITQEEKRKKELARVKENTLDIAQNVIEKQMRVAQEIASLLGETTAETKVALTKLKQVVLGEEGD